MSDTTVAASTTPAAEATTSTRRPDIQGLRAIAVLVVVAFHAGLPVPGGFVGVDIFFVISGFVITAMLHREWLRTGRISFGTFYLRRFKRLTPALALTVTVTLALSAVLLSPLGTQEIAAQTGAGAMLLVANFVIASTTGSYFDVPAEMNPLLNTWSLSVEEQFYLLFPLVLLITWALARRRSLRWAPVVAVAAIAAVSFLAALYGAFVGITAKTDWLFGFYSPMTRAWEFAAGALLALTFTRVVRLGRVAALLAGVAGLVLLAASVTLISAQTPFPGRWTLLPVAGSLLLLVAGARATNPVSRLLSVRPLVAVGDWSYSIYLWHWPFIVLAAALWPREPVVSLLAALVSLVPALASYRWLEQPIRRWDIRGRRPIGALVTTVVVVPLIAAGGLFLASGQGFWLSSVRDFQRLVGTDTLAGREDCTSGVPVADLPVGCIRHTDATGASIILLGDSQAGMLSDGLAAAGRTLGRPVMVATMNGCPFIDVSLTLDAFGPEHDASCREYVQSTLDWLATQPPSTVVLASSDRVWRDPSYRIEVAGTTVSGDTPEVAAALTAGLRSIVERIRDEGHSVVLVQAVPHFGDEAVATGVPYEWDPRQCSLLDITRGACYRTMSLRTADQIQGTSRAAIEAIADESGATVLDLRSVACDGDQCSSSRGGVPRYRDSNHITMDESLRLAPLLADAVVSATN